MPDEDENFRGSLVLEFDDVTWRQSFVFGLKQSCFIKVACVAGGIRERAAAEPP